MRLALAVLAAIVTACSASGDKGATPPGLTGDGGLSFEGGLSGGEGGLSGDAAGGNEDAACAAVSYTGKKIPASLLVLLDRSASMQKEGKWSAAVKALDTALAKSDDDLPVGLLFFPEGKFNGSGMAACAINPSAPGCAALFADSGCKDIKTVPDVAVAPLKTSRKQISDTTAKTGPEGDTTPTRWALKNAWSIMSTLASKGDRYVVLVTDGIPTTYQPKTTVGGFTIPESALECKDLKTIEDETAAASSATPPVKTFVIGAPGSETNPTFLSQVAINGKTQKSPTCSASKGDCHYQIGSGAFEADLAKALAEITGKLATCIFEVPTGVDVDPTRINVTVESGGTVELSRDESHGDGWDYTDASKTKIEVFGPQCDKIKGAPSTSTVKILLGCKTRVK